MILLPLRQAGAILFKVSSAVLFCEGRGGHCILKWMFVASPLPRLES